MSMICIFIGHKWRYIYEEINAEVFKINYKKSDYIKMYRRCSRCGRIQMINPIGWKDLGSIEDDLLVRKANNKNCEKIIWEEEYPKEGTKMVYKSTINDKKQNNNEEEENERERPKNRDLNIIGIRG